MDFTQDEKSTIVAAHIYTDGKLTGILPRTSQNIQQLEDLYEITDDSGRVTPYKLNHFIDGSSPVPDWCKQTFETNSSIFAKLTHSPVKDLLIRLGNEDFSEDVIAGASALLESGSVRTAEKVFDTFKSEARWQTQLYGVSCMNSLFKRPNVMMTNGYFDKVPLLTQNWNEAEFQKRGIRFIPGCIVRAGCYIGPGTTIMPGAIVNTGAYIAGDNVMIDGGARVATGAQIGKRVKLGAGSGVEGILEPAGMLPTIVEDDVRVGAQCELSGIIGHGSIIGTGVQMSKQKKIYDKRTKSFQDPLVVRIGDENYAIPYIPENRIAVPGSYISGSIEIACTVLIEKDARESDFKDIPKNTNLYATVTKI